MKTDYIVKSVERCKDGWMTIITTTSTGFSLDPKYGVTPIPGDTVTLYTKNFSEVRGVDLNRRTIFYKTDQCLELEREEWLENYRLDKEESFRKNKTKLDEDFNSLPPVFQARIIRFRDEDPKFRVDSEAYELFCCVEALKIIEYCKTPENVTLFKEDNNEEHSKAGLSEGHSGNTFYGACALAYSYLNGGIV